MNLSGISTAAPGRLPQEVAHSHDRSNSAAVSAVQRKFEAVAFQSMLGSMMPKESSKLFGTGSAGEMWKSLLTEKIADQLVRSGRVRLIPDAPVQSGLRVQHIAPAAAIAAPPAVVTTTLDGWTASVEPAPASVPSEPAVGALANFSKVISGWLWPIDFEVGR